MRFATLEKRKFKLGFKMNYLISVLLILIAFVFGVLLNDVPLIKFDNNINITDIINIALIIYIAFILNNKLQNRNSIKYFIIDELKLLIKNIDEINNSIYKGYKGNALNVNDKNAINRIFKSLDNSFIFVKEQIIKLCPSICSLDELDMHYIKYWEFITKDDFMEPSFVVSDDYINKVKFKYDLLINKLKKLICEIYDK